MTDTRYPVGYRFAHPTQGVCTVWRRTPLSVRYTFDAPVARGFGPGWATTTPDALAACLAAGVLTEV